ncbi:MAG TPA: DUF1801 domain-containing protein [Terracidiphilus sp.]|nr:DUF1801 domain-containing protein [Terracidiphilus sp.]
MRQAKADSNSRARKPAKAAGKGVGKPAVNAYLARVPEPARSTLEKVRAVIRAAAPAEAEEAISHGMAAFRYKGALVAYAAFKNHCSFFPMQSSLMDQMKEEVAGYRTAKGTLQFPLDKPLPAALVRKMVKGRVAENERKAKG